MLVINFVPTFSQFSMCASAEDVAWNLRGVAIGNEVYLCIDSFLPAVPIDGKTLLMDHQIIKHLMLALQVLGCGVEGCASLEGWNGIDGKSFCGGIGQKDKFKPLYDQLKCGYKNDAKQGLVSVFKKGWCRKINLA